MRALLLLIAIAAGSGWLLLRDYRKLLHAPLPIPQGQTYDLQRGHRVDQVLLDLQSAGLLLAARQRWYARVHVRLHPELAALKAGEYALAPGMPRMNLVELLALLCSGKTIMYELRLGEGWTFAQALAAVRAAPKLQLTLPADAGAEQIMQALGRGGEHPEGRFFPDTYLFQRDTADVALLRRAYDAAESVLRQEWEARDPDAPYETPYQALIMASIVEKETGVPEERAQIAGVFVRRLRLGMRLQTDPTVIYGVGAAFDGNLRKRDLLADTPYNTYTRVGLPPTPICLPGRAAIAAALHPAPGETLYFVSRGDGTHQFSESFVEHEAAVRQFQLRRGESESAEPAP